MARAYGVCCGRTHLGGLAPRQDADTQKKGHRHMSSKKRALTLGLSAIAIVSLLSGAFFAFHGSSHAAPAGQGSAAPIRYIGDSAFGPASLAAPTSNLVGEVGPQLPQDSVHPTASTTSVALPSVTPSHVNGNDGGKGGVSAAFPGLDHYDSRNASNGNQFSLEPPDQGLCASNDFVLEAINDVVGVYSAQGQNHQLVAGPTALNAFFKLPPSIIRSTPPVYGAFTSDPKCYYDQQTNRWFMTMLEISQNPSTGAFQTPTNEYIAVSHGASPAGQWSIFALDTTNPNGYSDCPCFGDQPLIGADAYGFYISTNEFPLFTGGFNGAQVYAMSKRALEHAGPSGTLPTVVHINVGALPAPGFPNGGQWYTLQPAETPPGGEFADAHGGTEYFLSALDFTGTGDNRIATWALSNTRSLDSHNPDLTLSHTVIGSEPYAMTATRAGPFAATQKVGSTPLADFLTANGAGPNPEELLNANDDRMNQVVYANGLLWSGVNTVTADGTVGVAYFIVRPSSEHDMLAATMVKQGYVTVAGNNVLFPSIAVNPDGHGVITFTLSGPNYYPSAAYAAINAYTGAGDVVISGAGVGPEDGFTGYKAYGGSGVARWGDYSAAAAAPNGSIWTADEYIGQTCTDAQFNADSTCGGTRTILANWGTFITNVRVSGD